MINKIQIKETPKNLQEKLNEWKSYGAVSTPKEIVDLMIDLAGINPPKNKTFSILEPACGVCNFLLSLRTKLKKGKIEFYGVEFNKEVFSQILYLNREEQRFNLINEDFLLWQTEKKFDLIIGNPPYGIIGDETHYRISSLKDRKDYYKRNYCTWKGKYNTYGAFIEKSIRLLKDKGKLVFIVPATWMILDEFAELRKFLSQNGKTKVYYLGKKIFKGVEVTSCIIIFEKGKKGMELYYSPYKNLSVFVLNTSIRNWNGSIITFSNSLTDKMEKGFLKIDDLFEIKISARSPELRTFPFKSEVKTKCSDLPVLNGKNLKKGLIIRENQTGFWIDKEKVTLLKEFYGKIPRIIVGHTKGGKIVAAIEDKIYPYVGDVYHLLPKEKMDIKELENIVEWLNSREIEEYLNILYKEITPHITKTQLKLVPLQIKNAAIKNNCLF
ncbi:MAG: N-6 DNA methylase [Nitrososphaeria archaeon]